ncbi:MAG TPA: hydrolase [Deltaproteobacteria bacterium]|nr:MAG: hydrolase [Deltaproteobacteria bacterium GWA2_55_82]OGQ62952.1 MAG: hydrolase [Deltaproteobacteria bacterium RIFCSPLOWO2_02_FULL_55_12]OIJ72914.1 MAG: hydrolase [Deltaproteobacteria bacterium GWC2_55_46]HBG46199.1 hydrolase [Deltaproteobacteria bacterium]HCY11697.1 hydrolase [Deltaproteobacteria bacterium]
MRLVNTAETLVYIPSGKVRLEGALAIPQGAQGIALFAHGSGSSRHSPRNNFVAQVLRKAGLGTLLMDLLTRDEDMDYETRFDIGLLSERLDAATSWLADEDSTKGLRIGYFGASTGAAAALKSAASAGELIGAVVSRGGRPDLAMGALAGVKSPTLLIIGGKDDLVIDLNRLAYEKLKVDKEMVIVPGATHLFEEPGALEEVANLAARWFQKYLKPQRK